jgi:hypothetical protein
MRAPLRVKLPSTVLPQRWDIWSCNDGSVCMHRVRSEADLTRTELLDRWRCRQQSPGFRSLPFLLSCL